MKHFWIKIFAVTIFLLPIIAHLSNQKVYSTQVTSLRDALSSSQLSYFARLDTGNTVNNTNINISLSGNPSNSTANLFVGDTVAIANSAGGSTIYTVTDIASTKTVSINTGIGISNVAAGSYVVATRSAVHTVSFYPQDSIIGSKWQILIKASTATNEIYNDGMPDQNGFDLGSLTSSQITCPWSATASIGGTEVVSGSSYHSIICSLGAGSTNPINVSSEITIGSGGINLINPSPNSGHTLGNSDVYTFYLRNLDASNNVVSTTQGKIAVNDGVQIIATIDPTITFYVDSIGTTNIGSTLCGTSLSAGAPLTTATSVNFGSLTLGQFNTLAQRFYCSTNAQNGYIVQAYQDKPLTTTSGSGTTIPDTDCDNGSTCSTSVSASWDQDVTTSQFGYSLQSINSSPVSFSAGLDFQARPFGSGFSQAQTIMSRSETPTSADQAYICYRITASNFQEAGTYQNQINFIATATF